ILESCSMKLILARFDRIVLGSLPLKLHPGAAGLHLKLIDGLNRNSQGDRATFALLNGVGDRRALDENVLGKSLGAVDLAPAIAFGDSGQEKDERLWISRTLADSKAGHRRTHGQWQVGVELIADGCAQARVRRIQLRRSIGDRDRLFNVTDL